jgi:hypothetical protein
MKITPRRVRAAIERLKENLDTAPGRAGLAAAHVTTGLQGEQWRLKPRPVQRENLRSLGLSFNQFG